MEIPETRYARSGDISIAYQVAGDGPFDVVFSGGIASHLDLLWEMRTFQTRIAETTTLPLAAGSKGAPLLAKRWPRSAVVVRAEQPNPRAQASSTRSMS